MASIGRRVPARRLRRRRTEEAEIARRMNTVFDVADVVLTPMSGEPPPLVDEVTGRGVLRSFLASRVTAWASPWNCIGQPAASVPAGLDPAGLPVAVQLCGRPGDEATLLHLAAQIEVARPWSDLRPSSTTPPIGHPADQHPAAAPEPR
jgi:amidase